MTARAQVEQKRIDEIQKLMAEIEIETDCNPRMIGAINSVAASGGEPSEEGIKLMILRDRGELTMDECIELVLYFAHSKDGKNR